MKKLSIRSIFILILVLVLAFALVACGEKDEPKPEPKPEDSVENVQAFFNTLWEKSSSIGNTKVGEKDDLKVDLGLTVKIATQDETGTEYQAIDLGVDLDLVLDRSSAEGSSEHTAIKARLYDPSNNETWVTLYYFFNDVDNVYVDFAGQNFKVPFDYLNDTFNKNFDNFINNEKIINKDNADKAKSIGEIITAVTENMGASWNLNTLVDDVVKLFGINLKDMIAGNDMIGGIIEGLLGDGATVDDVFDGDRLDINKILANENIARALFLNEETIVDQNGFYSTAIDLNGDIGGMVVGMIPEGVDKIINANTELYLQYQLKNNALDSFGIKAVLTEIESTVGETTVHPALTVNITDLKFAKATTNEIENSMPVKKNNYSTSAVLDASAVLDLAGFSLDATKLDSLNGNRFSQVAGLDNLQLKGQISVGLTGKVDLKDNNGTAAYAHLSYKADGAKDAAKVLEVSFVNGNLAVVVNQKANLVALDSTGKTVNVPIASTLVNLWGDYAYKALKENVFVGNPEVLEDLAGKLFKDSDHRVINPNFVGAEWNGLDIVTGFKGVVDGVLASFAKSSAADMATIIGNVVKTVERALPLVSTADNKLAVASDNIGNAVNSIGKVWWGKNAPDFKDSIIAADKSNWLDKFTEAIKIEGATYTTKQDFLKAIFNSSANVVLDMSKNGLTLDLDVKVTKDANVKLALNIGAKASATITDLSAGWKEDANTFVFNISQKPTGGSVSETGILTVNGVDGALVEAIYKRDIVEKDKDGKDVTKTVEEYVTIEGTWKDGVFTSTKALDGVKEGGLVKVRLTAKGSDGPCFGVKMTNNYKAPKTDAKK